MADLDDFFAKKDRKKAKGKKFATTDEIAKKLEETGKRLGKSKTKDKPMNPDVEETQQTEVTILFPSWFIYCDYLCYSYWKLLLHAHVKIKLANSSVVTAFM